MVNRFSDSVVNVSPQASVKNEVELVLPLPISSDFLSMNNDKQECLSNAKAEKMTESMNKFLETTKTELRFKYHEELETYYVTLINSQTDEVVREIPSRKLMDMYAAMRDFLGLFVDKKI